jgi:CheY-like chemotaxis protein
MIDSDMPEKSRLDIIHSIKQRDWSKQTEIIVLTLAGKPMDVAGSLELGASACLSKPTKYSELFATLYRATGKAEGKGGAPLGEGSILSAQSRSLSARVLLAEDSSINRKMVIRMLEQMGHTVTAVRNGKEVLQTLENQSFDIILMDVQMPRMGGLEATRAIRKSEKESNIRTPIVAMTAHAMEGDQELCLEAGMDAYIAKPISSDQVYEIIKELAGKQI